MGTEIIVPQFSSSAETVTVLNWLKNEGEQVNRGDVLCEVQTEKAAMEVEAFAEGVLLKQMVAVGSEIETGSVIAYVGQAGETVPELPNQGAHTPAASAKTPEAAPPRMIKPKATPRARRLARELGIDLLAIAPADPEGRITEEAVRQAAGTAKATPAEKAAGKLVPLTPMRRTIASRMQESHQTIPHVTLCATADARGLIQAHADHGPTAEAAGVKLTYDDVLMFILSRALAEDGTLNASFTDGAIRRFDEVHINLAVALENGLVVPVILNADKLSLIEIACQRAALVDKARSRGLDPADMAGGTFTITNLGMYPVDSFAAIINPPQAAILSVGQIRRTPVVAEDGSIVSGQVVGLSLTFDHRAADGAAAAQFLSLLIDKLTDPAIDVK